MFSSWTPACPDEQHQTQHPSCDRRSAASPQESPPRESPPSGIPPLGNRAVLQAMPSSLSPLGPQPSGLAQLGSRCVHHSQLPLPAGMTGQAADSAGGCVTVTTAQYKWRQHHLSPVSVCARTRLLLRPVQAQQRLRVRPCGHGPYRQRAQRWRSLPSQ